MFSLSWCSNVYLRTALHKDPFCGHRNSVFLRFFLRKIISTISNSSYTSQIHCKNALRLDPVIVFVFKTKSSKTVHSFMRDRRMNAYGVRLKSHFNSLV